MIHAEWEPTEPDEFAAWTALRERHPDREDVLRARVGVLLHRHRRAERPLIEALREASAVEEELQVSRRTPQRSEAPRTWARGLALVAAVMVGFLGVGLVRSSPSAPTWRHGGSEATAWSVLRPDGVTIQILAGSGARPVIPASTGRVTVQPARDVGDGVLAWWWLDDAGGVGPLELVPQDGAVRFPRSARRLVFVVGDGGAVQHRRATAPDPDHAEDRPAAAVDTLVIEVE